MPLTYHQIVQGKIGLRLSASNEERRPELAAQRRLPGGMLDAHLERSGGTARLQEQID